MTTHHAPRFADRLRQLRHAAGLSQEELAERAGLSVNAISQLERGERRSPHPRTVRALAAALSLPDMEVSALLSAARRGDTERGPEHPAPRSGLPSPMTVLLGRERDLAAIEALLGTTRLITLTGPGGVGKTRLAIEIATRAAAAAADGVGFVPLAGLGDPSLVLPAIGHAVGATAAGETPLAAAVAAALRTYRLLVLDNFEHLLPAAPAVAALAGACPTLTILVTSRSPLRLRGEQVIPVAPLALPESDRPATAAAVAASAAGRLFAERAGQAAPTFALDDGNAAAVAAICRRLDGLPLALELAAAWVPLLPPDALLARLDRELPLPATGPRDLPARQRTVRDTVAWSYDLLSAEEQVCFRRLAVFAGGFDLAAAEAIAGADLLSSLAGLRDASLVMRIEPGTSRAGAPAAETEPRYGMLGTIRQYGQERLVAAGEAQATTERHAAYFLALAEHAAVEIHRAGQAATLHRLERDHDNLRAALDWLLSQERADEAARLAWGLLWFWYIHGHLTEGRRWAERIQTGTDRVPLGTAARAKVRCVAGTMIWAQGAFAEALDVLSAAAADARSAGEPVVEAMSRLVAAHAALGLNDGAAALSHAAAGQALFQELNEPAGIGIAMTMAAQVAAIAGDLPAAMAHLDAAEGPARASGAPWALALVLNLRALVAQLQGDNRAALTHLRESLALSRTLGDTAALLYGLVLMAGALAALGAHQRAARLFGAVEVLHERTGARMVSSANRALHAERVDLVRRHLPPDTLAVAWQAGRALSLTEAIADALAPDPEA